MIYRARAVDPAAPLPGCAMLLGADRDETDVAGDQLLAAGQVAQATRWRRATCCALPPADHRLERALERLEAEWIAVTRKPSTSTSP